MEILNATTQDIPQIVSFQLAMALETENLILDKSIIENGVSKVFENINYGKYYIAKDGDTIVASLLTTFEWSDWRNSQVMWIQSVYVVENYRKAGVFKKMYAHLKNIVESSDEFTGLRLYVDKTNIIAQNVYTKMGMTDQHYSMFEWMK